MSKKKKKPTSGQGSQGPGPAFDPRMMEKMLQDITKLLEQQDFESIEEANAFLQQIASQPLPDLPPDDSPLGQAQELVYRASQADTDEEAADLARQAIERSPDCVDAYNLLAEVDSDTPEAALAWYEQAIEAGRRSIGPDGFEELEGHFWGAVETRPYMRALEGKAFALWALGDLGEAAALMQEMLRLNPGDNQGVRYKLADLLTELDRDDELEALLDAYEDDASANWAYNRALLLFRREGDSDEANAALREALACNPHVPDFLLRRKLIPDELPAFYGLGDENEAIEYLLAALGNWRNTHGAIRWVRRHTDG